MPARLRADARARSTRTDRFARRPVRPRRPGAPTRTTHAARRRRHQATHDVPTSDDARAGHRPRRRGAGHGVVDAATRTSSDRSAPTRTRRRTPTTRPSVFPPVVDVGPLPEPVDGLPVDRHRQPGPGRPGARSTPAPQPVPARSWPRTPPRTCRPAWTRGRRWPTPTTRRPAPWPGGGAHPTAWIDHRVVVLPRRPLRDGIISAPPPTPRWSPPMTAATTAPASTRRERTGWYFYDWANSAFSTTVITVFLGPFLTTVTEQAAGCDAGRRRLRRPGAPARASPSPPGRTSRTWCRCRCC